MRKKVDDRVKKLVEDNAKKRHRSLFVLVGDRGREQVVNLHYLLMRVAANTPILSSTFKRKRGSNRPTGGADNLESSKPSILWCYSKELGFTSHRKKRLKIIRKKILHHQDNYDPSSDDPFELFLTTTPIRYCYYKESTSVLGQTFGMCVLQDFQALTPDIFCRTMETVSGGGIICVLLHTMANLRDLYHLAMDSHKRYYRSDFFCSNSFETFRPLFNERLTLSLMDCPSCLVVDDELNVLPISWKKGGGGVSDSLLPSSVLLSDSFSSSDLCPSLDVGSSSDAPEETSPYACLLRQTLTSDQREAVRCISECIADRKALRQTIALTAGRGRGKSAALGLCVASAIAQSYSNIFITAPKPENVGTLFEFIQRGLEALGMKEHVDFELMQSEEVSDPSNYNTSVAKHVVRVNVFREHRQAVQYVDPEEAASQLAQAELVVIDEAAAIPLPTVKKLLGPYLVLLSSTIHGYEGTGRSLSLKLLHDIREKSLSAQRSLRELTLEEPIRYGKGDGVEAWLHKLLCLDATVPLPLSAKGTLATPSRCGLYLVNRQALFSYHEASEQFLHRLMSLFVSSHYKNSPNDLLLLADAPAHYLFVLLPPIDEETEELPDIYCAMQICIEGSLSKEVIRSSLSRGQRPSGDLLAWTLSQYFVDEDFGSLAGARIVRIATHPSLQRMGYGAEAVEQLIKYFEGYGLSIDESTDSDTTAQIARICQTEETDMIDKKRKHKENDAPEECAKNLRSDIIERATDLPPLLTACSDSRPSYFIDYLGTCFGLTFDLFKFWNRRDFKAVYVRLTKNEMTGEHSAIMLRPLRNPKQGHVSDDWLVGFTGDFRARMVNLLGSAFSHIDTALALALLECPTRTLPRQNSDEGLSASNLPVITSQSLVQFLTSHDITRLKKYCQQLADESLITDLLPPICWLFFNDRMPGLSLSHLQSAILLALGCQRRSAAMTAAEFGIPLNQTMALFNKAVHKISRYIQKLLEDEAEAELRTKSSEKDGMALGDNLPTKSFEDELDAGAAIISAAAQKQREALIAEIQGRNQKKKIPMGRVARMRSHL